jgi:Spherulation-specific family 4
MQQGVPAYFGPWQQADWIALKSDAPAVVVINPNSGPGQVRHPGYRTLVRSLRNRGCDVYGYVTTAWLQRATADCRADVERYASDYGVSGVLFDEVGVDGADLRKLRELAALSTKVAFNPGRAIPDRWRSQLPEALWITFEGTGRQYLNRVPDLVGRPRDWHLVHSVAPSQRSRVWARLNASGVGYGYTTADKMPNPWDVYDRFDR